MDSATERRVLETEWTCPGVPGRPSSLLGANGHPMMIGAKPCGVRIPIQYLPHKTRDVGGRLLCLGCASFVEQQNSSDTVLPTARKMRTTPEEVRGMRQWKEEVRSRNEDHADEEVDMEDVGKMNALLSGRKAYPVSGPAVCSNPHEQGKPLQQKIADRMREIPPEQHTLGKVYKESVV